MKLQDIIALKLNNYEIKLPKEEMIEPNPCGDPGYVAYGTKIKDGVEVPNCIPDPEQMKKIVKEGFPIPAPSSDEDEQKYVSRCISEIIDEYGSDVAAGICYATWARK